VGILHAGHYRLDGLTVAKPALSKRLAAHTKNFHTSTLNKSSDNLLQPSILGQAAEILFGRWQFISFG